MDYTYDCLEENGNEFIWSTLDERDDVLDKCVTGIDVDVFLEKIIVKYKPYKHEFCDLNEKSIQSGTHRQEPYSSLLIYYSQITSPRLDQNFEQYPHVKQPQVIICQILHNTSKGKPYEIETT